MPTLLSDTGVDYDDHRPPAPLAPDEGMAKRPTDLCEEGDVDSIVVSRVMGQWITPLAKAFPRDSIQKVAMARNSRIFTGGGGTDGDVGNGGGTGFCADGRPPPSATQGPGHDGVSPTWGFP